MTTVPGLAAVDLRLAPAALVVWAVTLVAVPLGWVPLTVLAGSLFGAGLLARRVGKSHRWINGILAVLVLGCAASAGMAARTHQVERHPLREVARSGAKVTVRVELDMAPRALRGESYGARRTQDRSLVRARLRSLERGDERIVAGGSVLLLVPSDSWQDLIAGQQVTTTGKAVPPRSGELTAAVLQVFRPPAAVDPAPGWQRAAEELRDGLRRTSATVLGPAAAGLLPGLVVGDTGALPPEVVGEFTDAGLTHLTAVSGSNLAIVCGAVLLLLRGVGAGPWPSALGASAALIGFVVLAGPEPSVLRAAVMGMITLLALVLGRERSAMPALCASVVGLLLVLPGLATDIGFALSVSATSGLVLLAPVWSEALRTRGLPIGIAEAVAVPAAAQLVTAPLIAAVAGEISLVSVLANLLAGPVIAPATVLGVLATISAPVVPAVAHACVWLAGPELEWVLFVARHAAAVPGATVDWPAGTIGGALLAVLTLVLLIVLRSRRLRGALAVLVVLTVLVLVPVRRVVPGWPEQGWSMVACDVGQGDGLVLSTGNPKEAVVVDTGPDPSRMTDCLARLGIRRVPLLVLSHLHADHVSGLSGVLADQRVMMIGTGKLREPAWAWTELRQAATADKVPVVELEAGQRVAWPSLELEVLGPTGALARTSQADDANDASLVLKASTPAGRILLTGDVELSGQSQLLAGRTDLSAEVIKVPHHGSRYTAPRFIDATQAELALISVGDGNSYGHPSPLVLGALARAGAHVARTDRGGDLAVHPGPDGARLEKRGDPIRTDD